MLYRFFCVWLIALSLCSCNRKEKVLVIVRGDSFADGIGSSGTTSSATFYQGKQVQGDSTWGKQLQRMLDQRDDYAYEVDMVGFPGQTAMWFLTGDQLPKLQQTIKDVSNDYKYIIYCSEFGTNEAANPGVNDSTSVDSLIRNLAEINKVAKNSAAYPNNFIVLGYPLTRRIDKYAQPASNKFRNEFNMRISVSPASIGADQIMGFRNYSKIYADDAPNGIYFQKNDVDDLSGVHLSDKGQHDLAEMTAFAVADVLRRHRK